MAIHEYLTVAVGSQEFGIPVPFIQDVLRAQPMTRVPLASPDIAGVLNLRGRIVTAIDLRRRLALPPRTPAPAPAEGSQPMPMHVVVQSNGEPYGFVVDAVGDVIRLDDEACLPAPQNLDPQWVRLLHGVYRLQGRLLLILEVAQVIGGSRADAARTGVGP